MVKLLTGSPGNCNSIAHNLKILKIMDRIDEDQFRHASAAFYCLWSSTKLAEDLKLGGMKNFKDAMD